MNKTLRIALACFLGATLGALLAIHFNRYFWWLGIVLGGLTGYLVYDFKRVNQAILIAWNTIIATELKLPKSDKVADGLRTLGVLFLAVGIAISSITLIGATWILVFEISGAVSVSALKSVKGHLLASLFAGIVAMICGCFFAEKILKYEDGGDRFWRFVFTSTNSLAIFLYFVPAGLVWLGRRIPERILSRFVAKVFILIHSDFRLLCMTDAALGALIGFVLGNPLIGGVSGALLGIVNYWIVSVRWLKLKPVPA